MRKDIKAMLPELPVVTVSMSTGKQTIDAQEFLAWLDKLTEGAQVVSALSEDGVWENRSCSDDTHTALLICPREIKKQTPLEIAVEAIKLSREQATRHGSDMILDAALAKIEAATC